MSRYNSKSDRNRAIYDAVLADPTITIRQLALQWSISIGRVGQILQKENRKARVERRPVALTEAQRAYHKGFRPILNWPFWEAES